MGKLDHAGVSFDKQEPNFDVDVLYDTLYHSLIVHQENKAYEILATGEQLVKKLDIDIWALDMEKIAKKYRRIYLPDGGEVFTYSNGKPFLKFGPFQLKWQWKERKQEQPDLFNLASQERLDQFLDCAMTRTVHCYA